MRERSCSVKAMVGIFSEHSPSSWAGRGPERRLSPVGPGALPPGPPPCFMILLLSDLRSSEKETDDTRIPFCTFDVLISNT